MMTKQRTKLEIALFEQRKSQTWLAKKLGLQQSGVSLIVRGKRRPDVDVALKIASLLHVPVTDI